MNITKDGPASPPAGGSVGEQVFKDAGMAPAFGHIPGDVQALRDAGQAVFHFRVEGSAQGGPGFFLRRPSRGELLLLQDEILRGGGGLALAQEKFVRSLFVGDNAPEFDAFLNQKPLAAGILFDEIAGDMGLNTTFIKTPL